MNENERKLTLTAKPIESTPILTGTDLVQFAQSLFKEDSEERLRKREEALSLLKQVKNKGGANMGQRVMEFKEKAQVFGAALFEMTQDEREEATAHFLILTCRALGQQLDNAIQFYESGRKEEAVRTVRDRLAEMSGEEGGILV